MKAFLFRFAGILRIAVRRLGVEWSLTLATAVGLTAAVALTMSIPLYADGVYFRLLRQAVAGGRPVSQDTPLSFRFRYVGARDGAVQWEAVQPIDAYLAGPAAETLQLPRNAFIHHFKTDIFRIYLPEADPEADALTWLSFATLSDLSRRIHIRQGAMPATASVPGGGIEVLVNDQVALQYAWQPGDTILARRGGLEIPVRVAGTWSPVEPLAGYWSAPLEELALVPDEAFAGLVAPRLEDEVYLGLWQVTLDGSRLHAGDIAGLLSRIDTLEREAAAYLPHVVLDASPVDSLQAYQRGVPELTFQLLAFSVPMMGILLAFVGLVGDLCVERRRNQIAVLRSRGATGAQVTGIAALEGFFLGSIALLAGAPLAMGLAWLIGRAKSFMNFTGAPDLRVSLTPESLGLGIAAVAIAQLAQLLPTMGAAGRTIVSYKQEQARLLRPPWWQRIGLDGVLLIPTGYSFYILHRQGSLAAAGGKAVHDIFGDPVFFLTPVLGLFALTLFVARLLPIIMSSVAWLATRSKSVALLLASRQLSRAPGMFTVPLMLLVLTVSLSAFTASLAHTLDNHLNKQEYYQTGADLRLAEMGVSAGLVAGETGGTGSPSGVTGSSTGPPTGVTGGLAGRQAGEAGARWFHQPVESHLAIPGVRAAARVGRYPAVVQVTNVPVTGMFLGIDRLSFPQVAYWQADLAPAPLGGLMNALAANRDGVLVTRSFLSAHGLMVGDPLVIIVTPYDSSQQIALTIVGAIDLFPSWYPDSGPLFVGNLDYLFEEAGLEFPHEVWLRTAPGADQRRIVAAVRGRTALLDPGAGEIVEDGLNIMVTEWHSAPLAITTEQERPQRQGLFGLLSVGFAASALLTVLGFMLYALFSFRRRFIELGVLRAIGLSVPQMIGMLAWELASLILIGMGVGTGLGVWISKWFIPYLQVGVEASSRFPPFAVAIAWPAIARIYVLFAGLFVCALAGLVTLLARLRISQAVKLGETT